MKILMTGSTGYIGSHLYSKLKESNYDIKVVLNKNPIVYSETFVEEKDIHTYVNHYKLKEFITSFNPDLCIHLASSQSEDESLESIENLINSNLKFSTELINSLSLSSCRKFINTGTSWQHYESVVYNPVNLYAATKQAFQDILVYYAEAFDFRIVTLKLFDTYGPNDHRKKIINLFFNQISSKQSLKLTPGNQLINLVHIDDIVEAYMVTIDLIVKDSEEKISEYGISANNNISIKSLVKLIEELSGSDLNIIFGGVNYRNREVFKPWSGFNSLPGWKPKIELDAGLKQMLNDFKKDLK
jgi:nucleoside-diphosphate-sugar epimerase